MKRIIPYIVTGLIAVAILGFMSDLIKKPGQLISGLAVTAIVIAIVIFFINRATNTPEQRSYKKAAKQSSKQKKQRDRRQTKGNSNVVSYSLAHNNKKATTKRKSDVHLTVIEGKKGKKKNRA